MVHTYVHTTHTTLTRIPKTSKLGEECSVGALRHPGPHTYRKKEGKKKKHPLFPAPCPSRQPQLQTQLLFSLQTTCYLGCQLCLFVKIYGPSWSESLGPPCGLHDKRAWFGTRESFHMRLTLIMMMMMDYIYIFLRVSRYLEVYI